MTYLLWDEFGAPRRKRANVASRLREEVLNVLLAQHLLERAIDASPENIEQTAGNARAMPDVLFSLSGVRCCIEGKFADVPHARQEAEQDIRERLETGVCQIGIAVIYPTNLRTAYFAGLDADVESAVLEFRIISESGDSGWNAETLETLVAELRRSFDLVVSDNVVTTSVEHLTEGMFGLTSIIVRNVAAAERLASLLGVYEPEDRTEREAD